MPVHDWTKVIAGMFHHLHTFWIGIIARDLNNGLLPPDHYALAEQSAREVGPDVLALHSGNDEITPKEHLGMTAVAEAPPQVSITERLEDVDFYALKRRSLLIKHTLNDELVAIIGIVSQGNKNRQKALDQFLDKAVSALRSGIHLLVIDLHPPGKFDPQGIHGALWSQLCSRPFQMPEGKAFTLAAYEAAEQAPRAYVEPIALNANLPDMPLFLDEGYYINVPLEQTYMEAWAGVPLQWRKVIEEENGSAAASQ
ncbi:MAG: DUF4058 family protein [Planctomycetota bacterium]|nr:DUF4058 family protein [Planctomycetota bacterium]